MKEKGCLREERTYFQKDMRVIESFQKREKERKEDR